MNLPNNVPRALSIFTLVFGLAAVGSGVGSLMGLSNPTYSAVSMQNAIALDNNLRFYGGLWFALGLVALWLVPRLSTEVTLFRAIFGAVFVGGIGRLLSMIFAGLPPPEFIAYVCIEIVGAPAVIYWHYRVLRQHQ